MYNENFLKATKELEKNLYISEKESLETEINDISQIISYRKSVIKNDLELLVKERVYRAYDMATNIYEKYKTTKSQKDIKNIIKTSLGTSIWNDGESFIWIIDYNGVSMLSPKYLKHFEGLSVIHLKDATGREIIKEEINICKTKGEGFLYDTFTKANGAKDKQYEQIVYVKSFGQYDWYFGSGEYIDTATKRTDEKLIDVIENVDTVGDHYIIMMNTDGNALISKSQPDLVGKNLFDIPTLKQAMIELFDTLKTKNSATVTYDIINPKTNKIDKKHTYFTKVPNSEWIIGSGFYISNIEDKVTKKKLDIYDIFLLKSKNILYIAFIVMIISLIISYLISRKLKESFYNYENNIESQKHELQKLNLTLESKVKQRTAELEKIKNDFEILATTDSLTKIHNRYSLMKNFYLEIRRSLRQNTPLCVLMFDIDDFKKVNDNYGHDVGDVVLSTIANLMQQSLRDDIDIAGRYGGEEFIALLPNTKLEDAKVYAERFRKIIDEYIFDIVGNVTVSIGLVQHIENETSDELFKRLDTLVYKSKHNGKNQISF
nr:cache domain-containing protein [uncultured Sulfurimonas sp.]